jgi:hypothetical protein
MKRSFSKLMLLLVAFTMLHCSDEPIVPGHQELTDDPATSITAYSPNIFVIEVTTIQHDPSFPPNPVGFELIGTGGKVSINWGDGTIEKVTLATNLMQFSHQYDRVKNYTIKIDGDIKNIEHYGMSYQDGVKIRNLHLSGLTGLKALNLIIMTESPEVINLSHNKLIEDLDLLDLLTTRSVIVPATNRISSVRLTGCVQLTTAAVDHIIGRLYQSVVSNPRTGSFNFSKSWWDTEIQDEMLGPPSDYSITKLRNLKNNYGWGVSPDPNAVNN